MRDRYAAGKKFKIIREGCHLSGMKPISGGYQGWSQSLKVGDVIESLGYGPGWGSDPGYGIHFAVEGIAFVEFRPSEGGVFNYHPHEGYLEEVQ